MTHALKLETRIEYGNIPCQNSENNKPELDRDGFIKINIPDLTSEEYIPKDFEKFEGNRNLNYDTAISIGGENKQFKYGFEKINGEWRLRLFLNKGTTGSFVSIKKFAQYKEAIRRVEESKSEFELLEGIRYAREKLNDKGLVRVLGERYLEVTNSRKLESNSSRYRLDTLIHRYQVAKELELNEETLVKCASELYFSLGNSEAHMIHRERLNLEYNLDSTMIKYEQETVKRNLRRRELGKMTQAQKLEHLNPIKSPRNAFNFIKDRFRDIFNSRKSNYAFAN